MYSELENTFRADQADRRHISNETVMRVFERDKIRRKKVYELIKNGKVKTGRELFMAALVFQHGGTKDFKMAIKLSAKAIKLGYSRAKWLWAAATDRSLMDAGKKQRFGTQFRKEKGGKYVQWPVDPKTTDEDRKKYDVRPLKEMLKRVEKMNKEEA